MDEATGTRKVQSRRKDWINIIMSPVMLKEDNKCKIVVSYAFSTPFHPQIQKVELQIKVPEFQTKKN